jgi:hypothetical protein
MLAVVALITPLTEDGTEAEPAELADALRQPVPAAVVLPISGFPLTH